MTRRLTYRNFLITRTSFNWNVRTIEGELLTNPPVESYQDAKKFIDRLIQDEQEKNKESESIK